MTSNYDNKSLSKVELLVLARLASPKKGASNDEVADTVTKFAGGGQSASDALAALRRRSLVTPKSGDAGHKLTDEGRDALCTALSIDAAPNWSTVQQRCLSVLGLGDAKSPRKPAKARPGTLAVLQQRLQISNAGTLTELCDVLLAKSLGFSGKVSIAALRAHVLARSLSVDPDIASTMTMTAVADHAIKQLQIDGGNGKQSPQAALGFHTPDRAATTRTLPVASSVTAGPAQPSARPAGARSQPSFSIASPPPRVPPPQVIQADALLNLVREAIPRIGSDGRFGPEKVFVSALWHYLERDDRLPDLSLDRFKRWLVTANRDQLVDLVRADSQGDMDGRLLEESEIQDLGSTFHFVIDRQIAASRRGYHAR